MTPGVTVREIQMGDLRRGFLESLDSLRRASDLDMGRAEGILASIMGDPRHKIFVAEAGGRIVGSTTLLIEQKFIHGGGTVGHIEDVVVAGEMQGRGVGESLIRFSLERARDLGCYKTILDCLDDVRGFYEGLGFARTSNGMRFDHRRS